MNNLLFKYYGYNSFSIDLFSDTEDLKSFLKSVYTGGGYFKKLFSSISAIGKDHAEILSKIKPKNLSHNDFPKAYYFTTPKSYGNIEVTSDFVNSLFHHGGKQAFKAKNKLSNLLIRGFYFKILDWGKVSKLLAAAKKLKLESNQYNISIKLTNQILRKTLQFPESIPLATDNELSLFLSHIEPIDYSLYQDLCVKELIIRDVKRRLENFSFKLDSLYLLGHFVKPENIWATSFANEIIANADFSQKNLLVGFYTEINKKYPVLAKGSLVSLIKEKLILSTS